jgi:hypothetical protein
MRSLNIKILLLSLPILAGCQPKSDVDKCIDAKWDLFQVMRKIDIQRKLISEAPLPEDLLLTIKMDHRMQCLHGSKIN